MYADAPSGVHLQTLCLEVSWNANRKTLVIVQLTLTASIAHTCIDHAGWSHLYLPSAS